PSQPSLALIPRRVGAGGAGADLAWWLTPWEVPARRWMVGASVIIIVMLSFAVYQLYDLKEQREARVVDALRGPLTLALRRLGLDDGEAQLEVVEHRQQLLQPTGIAV